VLTGISFDHVIVHDRNCHGNIFVADKMPWTSNKQRDWHNFHYLIVEGGRIHSILEAFLINRKLVFPAAFWKKS